MKAQDKTLIKHLTLAVVLKLLVLALLWWFFVRELVVRPNADDIAARIEARIETRFDAPSHVPSAASLAANPRPLQGARP